jgi:hypothetical protein
LALQLHRVLNLSPRAINLFPCDSQMFLLLLEGQSLVVSNFNQEVSNFVFIAQARVPSRDACGFGVRRRAGL